MKWLLAALRIVSEFAGVFSPEMRNCIYRVRAARGLGPSWSVTYAADAGENVHIRFDRDPRTPNWQTLSVLVHKATGEITVKAKMTLKPVAHAS